jgi:hypothetical protein
MKCAVLLLFIGFLRSYAQSAKQPTWPLTVCDLITQRDSYDGKLVTVRGEVIGSPEGTWLDADPSCGYHLVTNGVVWPNTIALAYPNNRSKDPNNHADFGIDWNAEKQADAIVDRLGFRADTDHLYETFVGLFRTYTDLDKRVNPNMPDALRLGFGHLGAAPALLLIKTRKDPAVIHGGSGKR